MGRAHRLVSGPRNDREPVTDPAQPAFLTSLTYQSVTLPGRDHAELDSLTKSLWVERLIEQGEVNSPEEAAAWIGDLSTHNPTYYQQRIAVYRREAGRRSLRMDKPWTPCIRGSRYPDAARKPVSAW